MTTNLYTEVKDSGARQEFNTGSVRDTAEGKGRFDLISPVFLTRLAQHTENGAKKYGDRNWEKGQPVSRFIDSALRHIVKYLEGNRDEDHMAAAAWNLQGVIHTEEMIRRGNLDVGLGVLPDYLPTPYVKDVTQVWWLRDGTKVTHDPGPFNKPEPWLPDLPEGWRYVGTRRLVKEGDYFAADTGLSSDMGWQGGWRGGRTTCVAYSTSFSGRPRYLVERTS